MFNFFKTDHIGEPLVEALRCFLGSVGIGFWQEVFETHGTLCAIEYHGSYPHSIYFRESMQIRNFMRTFHRSTDVSDWTAYDYDNRWEEATLRACRIKDHCTKKKK